MTSNFGNTSRFASNLLPCSMYNGNIKTSWYRKLYIKSCYNSKIFKKNCQFFFHDLPCQKKTVSIFPDENVSIILVNVTYERNMKTFWHLKLYIKIWSNSKKVGNIVNFSCMIFWNKNVSIPPTYILLWIMV